MKFNRVTRPVVRFVPLLTALALLGCVEPRYRTEVMSTGEGGVVVSKVPKDPSPSAGATSTTPSESAEADLNRRASMEDRLHALETQLHEKDAEIDRLKHQPPATAP